MTPNKEWFHSFVPLSPPRKVRFGDDSIVYTTDDMYTTTTIKNALLVPSFQVTLLSVRHLTKGGYYATFKGETAKLQQSETHQVAMTAKQNHGLYHVQAKAVSPKAEEQVNIAIDINVLHRRMGHMSMDRLKHM
ncbi:hypothetical protein M422DRAFT_131328, partial [Sphaerobolus stellatus SS14]